MKKLIMIISFLLVLSLPASSFGFGFEFSLGAWYQQPSGTLSFDKTTNADDLDLEEDLGYDDKWQPIARLKIDMPLLIPNLYLMYTPLKWSETGSKNVDFSFGGENFQGNVDFDSELKMNHLDVALYYGIPGIRTATADVLNIDLGLNFRLLDFKALDLEGRGIYYSNNHYVSLIGRLKVMPFGPLFVAGGYRYDNIKIDYQDIDVDADFEGPFAEAGFDF